MLSKIINKWVLNRLKLALTWWNGDLARPPPYSQNLAWPPPYSQNLAWPPPPIKLGQVIATSIHSDRVYGLSLYPTTRMREITNACFASSPQIWRISIISGCETLIAVRRAKLLLFQRIIAWRALFLTWSIFRKANRITPHPRTGQL